MQTRSESGNRKQVRICLFNMIELTLAMGAIAVGVISILALFPIGLNASRDSVARSYASNSAEEFLNYYSNMLKQNQYNWDTTLETNTSQYSHPPLNRGHTTSSPTYINTRVDSSYADAELNYSSDSPYKKHQYFSASQDIHPMLKSPPPHT